MTGRCAVHPDASDGREPGPLFDVCGAGEGGADLVREGRGLVDEGEELVDLGASELVDQGGDVEVVPPARCEGLPGVDERARRPRLPILNDGRLRLGLGRTLLACALFGLELGERLGGQACRVL